jgi:hypothetical protein
MTKAFFTVMWFDGNCIDARNGRAAFHTPVFTKLANACYLFVNNFKPNFMKIRQVDDVRS